MNSLAISPDGTAGFNGTSTATFRSVELQVELAQPADHVGRQVLVAPGASRAVGGLGHPDLVRPVKQALEDHASLGPGQRRARAGVDAGPERDVLADVGPVDVELVGALELARVAAGRPGEQ